MVAVGVAASTNTVGGRSKRLSKSAATASSASIEVVTETCQSRLFMDSPSQARRRQSVFNFIPTGANTDFIPKRSRGGRFSWKSRPHSRYAHQAGGLTSASADLR